MTKTTRIALALIVIALLRMTLTFRVFSQTVDEATHVGAGLEVFEYRTFTLQRENPPLPSVIMAAAPWLGGMRIDMRTPDYDAQLVSVTFGNRHIRYEHEMLLMRIGNLLFFAIAACALWAWAQRELGDDAALVALLLFTMQPIVLGYSALATHDVAGAAGLAVSLLAFSAWLRTPTVGRAALVGAAYGFAVLCKFSCIAFVPSACALIFGIRIIRDRTPLRRLPTMPIAIPVTATLIWAGYLFSLGYVSDLLPVADGLGASVPAFCARHAATRLPAPAFFWGVAQILRIDHAGMLSYFIGRQSMNGWRAYFPTAIALKTTLAFLALWIAGLAVAIRNRALRWISIECTVAAAAIVAVAMRSRLDLGVRYVLPAYVPMSLAAAAGTVALFRAGRALRTTAVALLVAHCIASIAAHPDYFPYFNLLAGREPGRYLVDSNLDWGQDVLRLRRAIRERNVDRLGVTLTGLIDLGALGFPPDYGLDETKPAHGWIAIGENSYRVPETKNGWRWLRAQPFTRIGTSIRLYHLP